jgi:hypothetical protein
MLDNKYITYTEGGPLSLESTIEELLERKSSGSDLENRDYGLGFRRADHATLVSPKFGANFADKAVARSVWFAGGLKPRSYCYYYYYYLHRELGNIDMFSKDVKTVRL